MKFWPPHQEKNGDQFRKNIEKEAGCRGKQAY
jgi:hypothetical protein